MDWQHMPPLAALRAFSAFADRRNVIDAGAALNVSHAAISQQLRGLEAFLGVQLLNREGRTLSLTDEGERLAQAVELGFGAIETAIQELTGQDAVRPLHISATPSFASVWLLPRLAGFRAKYPDIDLVVDPSPVLATLQPGGIDIALRYGNGEWAGLVSEPLLMSPMVIVAAPELVKGRSVSSPSDLAALPWLEELGTTEAGNWLKSEGEDRGIVGTRLQMPGNLLLTAAIDGQGVAVTVRHFVEPDLKAGRLVELFARDDGAGYHIVTRPEALRPAAKQFVSWLRRQRNVT